MRRVTFLFSVLLICLDCFGRKINKPSSIYSVKAKLLNVIDWIDDSETEISRLQKPIKKQKRYYLINNPSVYEILNANFQSMTDIIHDVKRYRDQIKDIFKDLESSETDSLQSNIDDQTTYDQKIGFIFDDFEKSKTEYEKSKKGLGRGLMRDWKKIVFINDKTNQWKNDFFQLSLQRSELAESINKFEIELNKMIFDNSNDKKNIRKLARRMNRFNKRLDDIESFVTKSDSIALSEIGGWVYIQGIGEKKPDFEILYTQYKKEYKRIIQNIKIELKEI
ncbi:MAG: hypothetical protein CMG62_08210 [Candidatus Marinimicrobia bacterium]|nr:hypothetical protein [Candidatus Neomarinimicrobiota bacterium]